MAEKPDRAVTPSPTVTYFRSPAVLGARLGADEMALLGAAQSK